MNRIHTRFRLWDLLARKEWTRLDHQRRPDWGLIQFGELGEDREARLLTTQVQEWV